MIKIYGQSDDLLEIEGDVEEEFGLGEKEANHGVVLGFSCGTLLKVLYDNEGIWRITVLDKGSAKVTHTQAMDPDKDYSDSVVIEPFDSVVTWVTKGSAYIWKNRLVDLMEA